MLGCPNSRPCGGATPPCSRLDTRRRLSGRAVEDHRRRAGAGLPRRSQPTPGNGPQPVAWQAAAQVRQSRAGGAGGEGACAVSSGASARTRERAAVVSHCPSADTSFRGRGGRRGPAGSVTFARIRPGKHRDVAPPPARTCRPPVSGRDAREAVNSLRSAPPTSVCAQLPHPRGVREPTDGADKASRARVGAQIRRIICGHNCCCAQAVQASVSNSSASRVAATSLLFE